MKRSLIAAACVLAASVTLISATPAMSDDAPAAAPAAQSPEAEQLGDEMAGLLMKDVDYGALLNGNMGDLDSSFAQLKGRPEWPDMFKQSVLEEIQADAPVFNRLIGHAFAGYFTLDELRSGVAFMRGPAGADLAKVVAEGALGHDVKLSPATIDAIQTAARDPAVAAFFEKFGKIGTLLDGVKTDFVAAFLPGVFRRFGEKAGAAEAAREAAMGIATAP